MDQPQAPEVDPDPSRPVAGETRTPLGWRPASVNQDRFIRLGPFAGQPASSVYALTHLASDTRAHGAPVPQWSRAISRLVERPRRLRFSRAKDVSPRAGVPGAGHAPRRAEHAAGQGEPLNAASTCACDRMTSSWITRISLPSSAGGRRPPTSWIGPRNAVSCSTLGSWRARPSCWRHWASERYLRAAARLADFDGPNPLILATSPSLWASWPTIWSAPIASSSWLAQGIAVDPNAAWRRSSLGLAYYRAGAFAKRSINWACRSWLMTSLRLDPGDGPLAARRKGRRRKALALADDRFESWCRERASGRGTAWVNWWFDGFQLVALRREAHELIDGHAPDDRAALAKVRAAMGNLIDDRDSPTWAYDLALRLEPGNVRYRNALAARLIELGRLAEAEPQLAAMVEGKTREPQAWIDRGMLLARAGQPDRAAADFARALELIPEDFHIFNPARGSVIELAASRRLMTGCLRLRPSDALLWYVRARRSI